jgi:hypothetical protein
MKATSGNESDKALGFWARLASALEAMETSSVELLESRVARLEHQVARLIGGRQRGSASTWPTDDEGRRS